MSKYWKRYKHIIDSYSKGYPSIRQSYNTKSMLVGELARRLSLDESRKAELIFKTTVGCLCTNLSAEEVELLRGRLPMGMKSWTSTNNMSAVVGLHGLLSTLKLCCGFYSMEDALDAAKEVLFVLGEAIDLVDLVRSLPEELHELALQVKDQQ